MFEDGGGYADAEDAMSDTHDDESDDESGLFPEFVRSAAPPVPSSTTDGESLLDQTAAGLAWIVQEGQALLDGMEVDTSQNVKRSREEMSRDETGPSTASQSSLAAAAASMQAQHQPNQEPGPLVGPIFEEEHDDDL